MDNYHPVLQVEDLIPKVDLEIGNTMQWKRRYLSVSEPVKRDVFLWSCY